jgi:hypothetical protein
MAVRENKTEIEQKATNYDNMIKVGTFQLQTKSFWIGLVTILVLFLLSIVWLNTYYWNSICNELIELNKTIIEYNKK